MDSSLVSISSAKDLIASLQRSINTSEDNINHHIDNGLAMPKYIDEKFNSYKQTPLMIACQNRQETIAIKLIDIYGYECLPQHIDKRGDTILMLACFYGLDKLAIKIINTFGYMCIPYQISHNCTVLIMACAQKLDAVAIKLITLYKDACLPEYVDLNGFTALMTACYYDRELVAIEIIKTFGKKCLINKINNDNMTSWEYAKQNKMIKVMELIKDVS